MLIAFDSNENHLTHIYETAWKGGIGWKRLCLL